MKKILVLLLLTLVFAEVNNAQDFKVNAQIRPRFEINNKDFNSDNNASTFTGMRTRLGVMLNKGNNLEGFIQFQDSRVWGTEPGTISNTRNVDVHQAFLKIKNFADMNLDIKMGRMEAVYGPQRLIGAVGWSNIGRSFDGVVLKFKGKKFDVDVFGFQEAEGMTNGDLTDRYFGGVYGNIKSVKSYSIQPFVLYNRAVNTNMKMFTLGAYVKGNLGNFSHELEAALQTGDQGENSISAMMLAANFNYTFSKANVKPTLSAGLDYLSGDDDPTDDEVNVFNTLFATNHKYYGYMDYFINIPNNTMGLGLTDIHVKAAIKPAEKLSLAAAFHMFSSSEDFNLNANDTATDFGSEVDITAAYGYSKNVKFQAGLSFFSPGEIFEVTRGDDTSTWFYFMTVVNL